MRKHLVMPWTLVLMFLCGLSGLWFAARVKAVEPKMTREIFVPLEALDVLLEAGPRRVLLKRDEYDALLQLAKKTSEDRAPYDAMIVAAKYRAHIQREHVVFEGELSLEVLRDGLQAIPLDLQHVGLRSATLDGDPAPIGIAAGDRPKLFVQGRGIHQLRLVVLAPLDVAAATQSLRVRLPAPATATMRLQVPGDVEVRDGAVVVSRKVDAAAGITKFELLSERGPLALTLSLNNRLRQTLGALVARSLFVNEVTATYERLHATVSIEVLHGETSRIRFLVPEEFEVTQVTSPALSQWAVVNEDLGRVLDIQLQEETNENILLTVVAARQGNRLARWSFARLVALDVVGQESIYGVVAERSLETQSLSPKGLVPIDVGVIHGALPESIYQAETGGPPLRSVAAFYAPHREAELRGQFRMPPARIRVTTNMQLSADDAGLKVHGGFALWPEVEDIASIDLRAPTAWPIRSITLEDGARVRFNRRSQDGDQTVWHVPLPRNVAAGTTLSVYFESEYQPTGWLDDWATFETEFPQFSIEGAYRDSGAIAVSSRDDLGVRPALLEHLSSLDNDELETYGLTAAATNLAYRYERRPYSAKLIFERIRPTITARAISFFRVESDSVAAHYELTYDVRDARTQTLSFDLPQESSRALSIRGMGVELKDYSSSDVDNKRRWTVHLAEARRGSIRLAIDLRQEFDATGDQDIELPMIRAAQVAYQSGSVAVEGTSDYDVRITGHPRPIDVAELIDAEYQPGRRLLGTFGYVGEPETVAVRITRNPGYDVPATLVQRAQLLTRISGQGASQTAARYLLQTRARFLEVSLPPRATLLSVRLDGQPVLPQRDGTRLVISLPAVETVEIRDLQLVYEAPIEAIGLLGDLEIGAPALALRDAPDVDAVDVPSASAQWDLYLAHDLELDRSTGTVFVDRSTTPKSTAGNRWSFLASDDITPFFDKTVAGNAARRPATEFESAGEEIIPRSDFDAEGPSIGGAQVVEGSDDPFSDHIENGPASGDQDKDPFATAEQSAIAGQSVPDRPAGGFGGGAGFASGGSSVATAPKDYWALAGNRSLLIDLIGEVRAEADNNIAHFTFRSLGDDPRLTLRVVDRRRLESLTWGMALLVLVSGVVMTRRTTRTKLWYMATLLLAALLLPPVFGGSHVVEQVANAVLLSNGLLAMYYVVMAVAFWSPGRTRGRAFGNVGPASVGTTAALVLLFVTGTTNAQAQQPPPPAAFLEWIATIQQSQHPVHIPDNAVLVPYDSEHPGTIDRSDEVFVPYDKYIELWKIAYGATPAEMPPVPFALAGGHYEASLSMDRQFVIRGSFELHVFSEDAIDVPLPLEGGVLASATIDGQSAQLRSVQPNNAIASTKQTLNMARDDASFTPITVLRTSGKGVKQLALEIRLQLTRRGGWRVVQGRLPVAAATALDLAIATDQTEVRLIDAPDQREFQQTSAGDVIESALPDDGSFHWQWRPRVTSGDIDHGLTAESEAVFDVREDGLHLDWRVALAFRGSGRRTFEFLLPEGYFVEWIDGPNVRGWEVRDDNGRDIAEVTLLSEAQHKETVELYLSRRQTMAAPEGIDVNVPIVTPRDAALHHGRITVRRSPRLDVRASRVVGASRTDVADIEQLFPRDIKTSALGVLDFQAFQFTSKSPDIVLFVAPEKAHVSTTGKIILRLTEDATKVEARISVQVRDAPIYHLQLELPAALEMEQVAAPGLFQYAVIETDERKRLNILLPEGQSGSFDVVIRGTLQIDPDAESRPLPWIDVLEVDSQGGTIVVLTDPAFDVHVDDLKGGTQGDLKRTANWLSPQQRTAARLVIHDVTSPYGGRLRLIAREPIVTTQIVSNVRVTDRSVEETIVIECNIKRAGIREVTFLLPQRLRNARIRVPRLRQKTVVDADDREGWVRVTLELEDDVLGQLRVLIEHDRVLTSDVQHIGNVVVETGRTIKHYVTLESSGRDEVIIETQAGLEPLDPQHSAWKQLSAVLGGGLTKVFLATGEGVPSLGFRTRERSAVRTVGAEIRLADATLMLDGNGSYRGTQVYHVQNTTEPYLIVELPFDGRLWTAHVAEEPVKPTRVAGAGESLVRIPLVKTSAGDRDYEVRLVYGGRLPRLESIAQVDFPLLRVENIGVLQSQVRLMLPRTHRWFDFGGSMGLVEDQVQEERALLDYGSAQLEDLLGVIQDVRGAKVSSSYKGTRARVALESLVEEQSLLQNQLQKGASRTGLTKELLANGRLLKKARQELQRADTSEPVAEAFDNRGKLKRWFSSQLNYRAKNTVDKINDGFTIRAAPSESRDAERQQIERGFIQQNGLSPISSSRNENIEGRRGNLSANKPQDLGGFDVDGDSRLFSPNIAGQYGERPLPAITMQSPENAAQEMAQSAPPAARKDQRYYDVLQRRREASAVRFSDDGVRVRGRSQATMGSLSSLPEVVLDDRGVVYRFSTARGDTRITARAVSDSLVKRGERIALVFCGAFVLAMAYRWLGEPLRRVARWLDNWFSVALLFIVGLVGLCAGIVPLLGLFAVGIATLVTVRTWVVAASRRLPSLPI